MSCFASSSALWLESSLAMTSFWVSTCWSFELIIATSRVFSASTLSVSSSLRRSEPRAMTFSSCTFIRSSSERSNSRRASSNSLRISSTSVVYLSMMASFSFESPFMVSHSFIVRSLSASFSSSSRSFSSTRRSAFATCSSSVLCTSSRSACKLSAATFLAANSFSRAPISSSIEVRIALVSRAFASRTFSCWSTSVWCSSIATASSSAVVCCLLWASASCLRASSRSAARSES
mmetsp:Transcript_59788/g.96835  ORF Transcript_59788/g.96835 Transcript_59788/m.96835 type:complete len:234 (+) Transcript_59788:568-1269(+)